MTAVLDSPRTAVPSVVPPRSRVRRSQTAIEQFEQRLDYRYPLFGTIARRRRIVSARHIGNVATWITSTVKSKVTSANMRHIIDVCASQHPTWFDNLLFVRMEQRLHGLEPGIRLFVETRNFDQIPDPMIPRNERTKFTAAIVNEPNRSFAYLEPLWITVDGKQVGATVEDFIMFSRGQMMLLRNAIGASNRQLLFSKVDAAIEMVATLAALSVIVPTKFAFDVVARMGRSTAHFYEGAKEFGYDLIRSSASYIHPLAQRQIDYEIYGRLYAYDPFIVFGTPEMSELFGDELPLALVADWE